MAVRPPEERGLGLRRMEGGGARLSHGWAQRTLTTSSVPDDLSDCRSCARTAGTESAVLDTSIEAREGGHKSTVDNW